MELKPDLNIENKNGYFSIESRTDKGVGIFITISSPVTHLALSEQETLQLTKWLVEWINTNTKIM